MDTSVEKFFQDHKNDLGTIGEIITIFNRIENIVTIFISGAFASVYGQERMILINDILNDVEIFETFEKKIKFLEKLISRVALIGAKSGDQFDDKKYLAVCKAIRRIQKYRNKIAHMSLAFSPEGKAVILKRKKDKDLLTTTSRSFDREEINLEEVKIETWNVYRDTEETLMKEGSTRVMNILLKEELKNLNTTKQRGR